MRARPKRLDRLPQQYFVALLGRVAAAAAAGGPPLVDLGRGNPEIGPPSHVVEALSSSAVRGDVHGYPPIRGLAATKEALAARYPNVPASIKDWVERAQARPAFKRAEERGGKVDMM